MIAPTKLLIASDHGGFQLKEHLKKKFSQVEWVDLGCHSDQNSVDYPDYADELISQLQKGQRGVLICGSGQGMAIRANKYPHIRAALCWSEETAALCREHNDANILCLGGRLLSPPLSEKILNTFLNTDFEGGRHSPRVKKLEESLVKNKINP